MVRRDCLGAAQYADQLRLLWSFQDNQVIKVERSTVHPARPQSIVPVLGFVADRQTRMSDRGVRRPYLAELTGEAIPVAGEHSQVRL